MTDFTLAEAIIGCPYCGEEITILIDPSVIPQDYIEDCQVCCRPIEISVNDDGGGGFVVSARDQDEVG